MWFNEQRRSIALSNIRRVSSPVKTVEEKRASDKVILQAENGDHFILNTDPGLPRLGMMSVLINLIGRKLRGLP
jgi:hypothetical protein